MEWCKKWVPKKIMEWAHSSLVDYLAQVINAKKLSHPELVFIYPRFEKDSLLRPSSMEAAGGFNSKITTLLLYLCISIQNQLQNSKNESREYKFSKILE